jgi:undecaprenyl-diphosphatase
VNFMVGMLVSFVTGIVSVGFLLRYVQTKDFLPFACYRFIIGALVIVIALTR